MSTLSYKTQYMRKEDVEQEWFVVDATDQTLGRLASRVAAVVRGKHKPGFTPSVNCGDHVIVINAEKVKLTGQKWTQKEYIRYTGYPGGQRRITPKALIEKHPIRLMETAVRGMLPKNKLGAKLYKNLHVYEGAEHPHEAQKPKEFKF